MSDFTLVIDPPAELALTVTPPAQTQTTLVVGQGPAGPPASGVTRTVSGAIGGHRLVASIAADVVYADATQPTHMGKLMGLTLNAASPGGTVEIRSDGEVTEPSWTWTPDQPVYLGTNGLLTQTVPNAGTAYFLQKVGFAVAATRLFLTIDPPITL